MKAQDSQRITDTQGWSDEWLIQAYLDDQLGGACVRDFEARLDAEPGLAEAVCRQEALKDLFRADAGQLPPMPEPACYRWMEEGGEGGEVWSGEMVGRGVVRFPGGFLRSLATPAWNHPLLQAAAVFVLLFGLVRFRPRPVPEVLGDRSAKIISLDLPQEGTGAYVYEEPDSNLTIVWVTGLTDGPALDNEPES